ncbi:TPA: TetR/AcrR family transcriptional regulator [Listeria monocytogenes]|uniref:bile-regulated transcriptional regulator BrtA n=1 Tax=Listeria monocytogenes TaxID=1639 RepID=UPI0010DC9640|nr:bile-regulated transcriptional regulator BrtA [Listeria monocytogenes]EAD5508883.1 TetR/AcrR family transcriptional regulator [Listeria monocytogenes]EAD5523237.1 TetR/AcrR family transcriptional regulator [Listeria monocytogenes]MCH5033387.1 TetR/AcrR family transcriptional regulator [Listeria monocytogenes]HDT8552643.1 TetR/AcrR family transcriptional regulator [Listeria monocytogenes]HDT8753906.1 TetR/AcrR family transcriptional regulator [Listeria monocytogenes]
MKEKKQRIIKSAKEVFQKQGYLKTSVQDMVDAAGISKGTFYNYFTSKEELAIVIFKQEYSVLHQRLEYTMAQDGAKKDNFTECLKIIIHFYTENGEILNITFSQTMIDDDFNAFLQNVRLKNMEWVKYQLLEVYGEETKPYINDITMLLSGMAAMYVFASGSKNVNTGMIERAIPYVVRRLDALVKDILESGEIVFTEADTENLVPDQTMIRKKRLAKLREALEELNVGIENADIADSDKWQYKESMNALVGEINNNEAPRDFMVQGTLLYLKQHVPASLTKEVNKLEACVNGLL